MTSPWFTRAPSLGWPNRDKWAYRVVMLPPCCTITVLPNEPNALRRMILPAPAAMTGVPVGAA